MIEGPYLWLMDPDPDPGGLKTRGSGFGSATLDSRVHKTTYAPIYGPVRNAFDACRYITWGSGGGVGAGNLEFFGPLMALAYRLVPFHRGHREKHAGER